MNRPCLRLLHQRTQFRCSSTAPNPPTPSPIIVRRPTFPNVQQVCENPELTRQNLEARKLAHLEPTIQMISTLNGQRRKCIQDRAPLQGRKAELSKEMRTKLKDRQARLREEAIDLKARLAPILAREKEIIAQLESLVLPLPNFTHPDVPSTETQVDIIGELKEKIVVKDHIEIAEDLDILDLRAGAKTAGHAWYYLKGMGVQLERALVSYAMDMAVQRGWKLVKPPDVIRTEVAIACGFRPRDEQGDQIYQLSNTAIEESAKDTGTGNLCLAGTAEIPLAAMYMDHVFPENLVEELPVRYVGVGTAYRAEAGNRGRESKGLYRVHQFTKVELFAWTTEETSDAMLGEILQLQKDIVGSLGLHARVLDMPPHELGNAAYRKYDIEAWMYGRQGWGEITSASNCTDYQSRRLNTQYRRRDGKHIFAHTLNGTAMAVPRMIIAILESGLQEDGSVAIPEVLQKYLGAEIISKPVAPEIKGGK